MKEPPPRVVKMKAEQSNIDNISRGMTNGMEHMPYSIMMTPVLSGWLVGRPMQANCYHKPSAKCKHLIGGRCSHNPSPASISANSPNNNPTSSKIDSKCSLPFAKTRESKKELLIEAADEIEHAEWPGQEAISKKNKGSLMPCSTEDPPSRTIEARIEQCHSNFISKKTTGQAECSPHAAVGPKLIIPSTQDKSLLQPTGELAPSIIKNSRGTIIEMTLPGSGPPASPNNDLLSNKIICQFDLASLRTRKNVREGELLIKTFDKLICLEEEAPAEGDPLEPKQSSTVDAGQHSQNVVSMDIPNVAQCSPHASASPFLPMIRPIPLAEGSCQWLEHKPNLPFTKVSGDKEARPDQTAISEIVNSARWHSQESAAAHMRPTNEPVSRPPAYTLR
jgi:hypothetical protein